MDLRVPEARLFCVEFPGYVQDEERALQTLGGLDGLARQLQDNAASLPLNFRCAAGRRGLATGRRKGSWCAWGGRRSSLGGPACVNCSSGPQERRTAWLPSLQA